LALAVTMMGVLCQKALRYLAARGGRSTTIASILARIKADPQVTPSSLFVIAEENQRGFTLPHLFTGGRAVGTLTIWAIFFLMRFDVFCSQAGRRRFSHRPD